MKIIDFWKGFLTIICQVSSKPHKNSYTWDGKVSICAYTTFMFFFIARIFSPLQWIKYMWRRGWIWNRFKNEHRPDFHARNSELYYLISCLLIWVLTKNFQNVTTILILYVLLFESIIWIIYYSLIRSYTEYKFYIYHSSEYLIILPVIFFQQTMCICNIYGYEWKDIINAIYLQNEVQGMKYIDNIIFSTLGYFYYTIVFVGILKGHRGLPSRSSLDDSETNPISRYEIVGAGEIVANRLLPALISQGIHQSCITIRDFEIDKKLECSDDADRIYSIHARIRKKYKLVVYKSMNEMKNSFWNISNPVFICCTQSSHWRILRQIHACSPSVPIALEKPAFLPDQINDELRSYPNFDKVFFLSYYTLEKALPLTFLFLEQKNFTFATPYGQLLSGFIGDKNSNLYSTTDVAKFIRKIALFSEDEPNITNIEITILENEDRRLWANNSVYGEGGFLLETFLHALLLLRRISPRYLKFEKGESNSGQLNLGVYRPKNYPYSDCNQCSLKEFSNGATINIKVGKYLDSDVCKKIINQSSQGNSSRYCKIQFRNNTYISIDFNTSSLKFYDGHDKELASLNLISNDIEKNNIKYNVQVKLFQSFCNSGASWNQLKSQGMERYDEMDGQMQLIPLIGDVMRRAGLGAIRGDNWQEKYGARVIPIQILKDEAEVCNFYSQDAC